MLAPLCGGESSGKGVRTEDWFLAAVSWLRDLEKHFPSLGLVRNWVFYVTKDGLHQLDLQSLPSNSLVLDVWQLSFPLIGFRSWEKCPNDQEEAGMGLKEMDHDAPTKDKVQSCCI